VFTEVIVRGSLGPSSMQVWFWGPVVLQISSEPEVRRANNKKRNFCSYPQGTKHLNSHCDLLTEIDMIISVRDCLLVDVKRGSVLCCQEMCVTIMQIEAVRNTARSPNISAVF